MPVDFAAAVADLDAAGMLPRRRHAVVVVGSMARGWDNDGSDIDLLVFSPEPWRGRTADVAPVRLQPAEIAVQVGRGGGRRCELKYWLDTQLDQWLEKVSWAEFNAGRAGPARFADEELGLLERLPYAVAVDGAPWLARQHERLRLTAYRSVLMGHALTLSDEAIEDALGQLAAGDGYSAALSARQAFGWTVDALLAHHGEYDTNPKWRARKVRALAPAEVTFEEFWTVEIMRGLDPADPGPWVIGTLERCRDLATLVDLGVSDDPAGIDVVPSRSLYVRVRNRGGLLIVATPDGQARRLSETGSQLWRWMDGRRSIGDLAELLTGNFEVDIASARADVGSLVAELVEGGYVTVGPTRGMPR